MKTLFLLFIILLTSCTTEVTYQELTKIAPSQNQKHPQISTLYQTFYIGSDKEYDFFKVTNFISSRTYQVTRGDSPLTLRFERDGLLTINIKDLKNSMWTKKQSFENFDPQVHDLIEEHNQFKNNDKTLLIK
jgi:hypothetical protein